MVCVYSCSSGPMTKDSSQDSATASHVRQAVAETRRLAAEDIRTELSKTQRNRGSKEQVLLPLPLLQVPPCCCCSEVLLLLLLLRYWLLPPSNKATVDRFDSTRLNGHLLPVRGSLLLLPAASTPRVLSFSRSSSHSAASSS